MHARGDATGARPGRPRPGALPAAAFLGALLRPVDAHEVVVGRRGGAPGRAARHRRWFLDAGQPRRDLGRDWRDVRHELARARHSPRSDSRRRQQLHARREERDRRLPRRDGRRSCRSRRESAVRHRSPDANARRPAMAAREVPRGTRGEDGDDELGLLAELREAAVGRAGDHHALHALRNEGTSRASRGLSADGSVPGRGECECGGLGRVVQGDA